MSFYLTLCKDSKEYITANVNWKTPMIGPQVYDIWGCNDTAFKMITTKLLFVSLQQKSKSMSLIYGLTSLVGCWYQGWGQLLGVRDCNSLLWSSEVLQWSSWLMVFHRKVRIVFALGKRGLKIADRDFWKASCSLLNPLQTYQ